ncbi:MAG: RNA polymerase sigma factor RpoD/SigA [Planctomycetota bacterium]|nr:RNA polymerase sigma factor RpoD/SigA [Planctomycetota bacterium]
MTVEVGLQQYLKQINESALLSADDEKELACTIARGAEAAGRFPRREITLQEKERLEYEGNQARERMIRANLRLVVNIAKSFTNRGMPLADIIEEGNLGLLRAVEGFDPDMGARFSTYASWWIKQAIKRSLINTVQPVHIPAYMVEMIARWKQAHSKLQEALGRAPTIQEISEKMQLPERKVRIIKRAVRAFSAPTQTHGNESGASLLDMLPDEKTPSPDQVAFNEAESATIQSLLDALDQREATILRLRYGLGDDEPLTLKEIGKEIGLTRERVRQIEHEALGKLQVALSES